MTERTPSSGPGFNFPIKVNAKGGLDWSSGPERIQDAIWIILSTSLGERVMRPTFGRGWRTSSSSPTASRRRSALAERSRTP